MRAIRVHRFGGPEELHLEERPDPVPGQGQVLIRCHAAGVNPVDTYIRSGRYGRLPELPYIPGWDGAGVVEAVGGGVTRFQIGDRVYFSGTTSGRSTGAYASLVCAFEHQVHPLPQRLSFSQGAAIGVPYGSAHRALFARGGARPGETVLVHGASGGVGTAAVQLARAHGCRVIGTAGSEGGMEVVREAGADHVFRHGTAELVIQVRDVTGGQGPTLILEMLANENLERDLEMIALQGRIVVVGSRGRIEIDPRQTMARESAVLGMMLWHATDPELEAMHQAMAPLFASGALTPVVGLELPLEEAARAHEAVLAPGHRGKIVLLP
jgi:NADPH2:quinone reductase